MCRKNEVLLVQHYVIVFVYEQPSKYMIPVGLLTFYITSWLHISNITEAILGMTLENMFVSATSC